jgi:hypothetical protein
MQTPLVENFEIETPAGRMLHIETARSVDLSNNHAG